MTNRSVDVRITLGPRIGAQEGYKRFRKTQAGPNSPRNEFGFRLLRENAYTSYVEVERNEPLNALWQEWGHWKTRQSSMYSQGGSPVPTKSLTFPDPYSMLGALERAWKGSKFNAGVTLGEGRESAKMMVDRLVGVTEAARRLKKGDLGGAIRNLTGQTTKGSRSRAEKALNTKDISGAFLELNLGWSPMLKDVYEGARALDVKPYSSRIRTAASTSGGVRPAGSSELFTASGEHSKFTQIIVDVTRPPTSIERFGLTDPASVAWELVPLSFVADWAWPIGNSLENFHAVGALPVRKVIITFYERFVGKTVPVMGRTVQPIFLTQPIATREQHRVTRSVEGSIQDAISLLSWAPQSFVPKWDPDLWKLGIAASLFRQTLRTFDRGRF